MASFHEATARRQFEQSIADGSAQKAGFFLPGDDPEWAFNFWKNAHFANMEGRASPDSPVGSGFADTNQQAYNFDPNNILPSDTNPSIPVIPGIGEGWLSIPETPPGGGGYPLQPPPPEIPKPGTIPGNGGNNGGTGGTGFEGYGPGGNYQNGPNPFQFNPDNFNLPMYEGPYAAPITEGMFDSVQGFRNLLTNDPLVQTQNISSALERLSSGDKIFDPANGGDINKIISDYTPDNIYTQGLAQTVTNTPRFDNTDILKNLEVLFNQDLDNQTAELQEQFSGFGLGAGSSDRLNTIASNAGNARARFRVGIGELEQKAFEDAERRRLGAVMAGLDQNKEAFNRFYGNESDALERMERSVPLMMNARNSDLASRSALFDMETAMRNMADQEIVRQMGEFQRTQGGGLRQYLDIINSASPSTVAMGPSPFSQYASVGGAIVSNLPELVQTGKVIWDAVKGAWEWANK